MSEVLVFGDAKDVNPVPSRAGSSGHANSWSSAVTSREWAKHIWDEVGGDDEG